MQLGTWTIPLLPAGAVGVAVALAGLVLWGVYRVRAASRAHASGSRYDDHDEPQYRDWTGEAAGGAADPLPPPPSPAPRLTVADVVAARRADTQPMAAVPAWTAAAVPGPLPAGEPVRPGPPPAAGTPAARHGQHRLAEEGPATPSPDGTPAAHRTLRHAGDLSGDADGAVEVDDAGDVVPAAGPDGPTVTDVGGGPLAAPVPEPAAPHEPDLPASARDVDDEVVPADEAEPDRPDAGKADAPDVRTTGNGADTGADTADVPDLDEDTAAGADGPEPVGTGPVPPPWSPARAVSAGVPDDGAGSPEPVSFAVRQALAARAVRRAQGRPDVPDLAADDVPTPLPDARDRLLSVLLTDPVTALGATTDLDDTRARIDQLGDVLRRRRADLAAAVRRLHTSGLTGEQIGQLAGLDRADVREILEQASGEGSGGR